MCFFEWDVLSNTELSAILPRALACACIHVCWRGNYNIDSLEVGLAQSNLQLAYAGCCRDNTCKESLAHCPRWERERASAISVVQQQMFNKMVLSSYDWVWYDELNASWMHRRNESKRVDRCSLTKRKTSVDVIFKALWEIGATSSVPIILMEVTLANPVQYPRWIL